MYGTRDAGALWEATYTSVLLEAGFVQGSSNPCCFHHPEWNLSLVVHGDDFTCLGTAESLDKYERHMCKAFEVELRGPIGCEAGDATEMKVLNRILRVTSRGLAYEADPRHAELLAVQVGLELRAPDSKGRAIRTPCVKQTTDEEVLDEAVQHEDEALSVMAVQHAHREPLPKVKHKVVDNVKVQIQHHLQFSPQVEVLEVPYQQDVYGRPLRSCVVNGRVESHYLEDVPAHYDPWTGLSPAQVKQRRLQFWNPQVETRAQTLLHALVDGAQWEVSTPDIIAHLSINAIRKSPKKFQKKRVGNKQAKREEALDSVGEVLDDQQATAFRALAARANYLALDRPDICFGAKELCREFARPTAQSAKRLKRLIRYLCWSPRLVRRYDFEGVSNAMDVWCDTDFAGCLRTRRSTSGGVATLGSHVIGRTQFS